MLLPRSVACFQYLDTFNYLLHLSVHFNIQKSTSKSKTSNDDKTKHLEINISQ